MPHDKHKVEIEIIVDVEERQLCSGRYRYIPYKQNNTQMLCVACTAEILNKFQVSASNICVLCIASLWFIYSLKFVCNMNTHCILDNNVCPSSEITVLVVVGVIWFHQFTVLLGNLLWHSRSSFEYMCWLDKRENNKLFGFFFF